MATLGGPAQVVSVQTTGQQQGGAAIPVAVVTDGRGVVGGPAMPVYVVTSGPVQGGPALPVVAAAVGRAVQGGAAIPVFVVSGSFGIVVNPLAYALLRDMFTDTMNPTVDGSAVPGAGVRDVTGALIYNLGGALRGGSQTAAPAWGSSKLLWTASAGGGFTRVAGRTFVALVTLEDSASDMAAGWDTATNTVDPRTVGHGWVSENGTLEAATPGVKVVVDANTRTIRSMQYLIGVTLSDIGAVVWISSFGLDDAVAPAAGFTDAVGIPQYPTARIIWTDYAGTTTPLYPYVSFYDSGNGATTYPNGQCIQDVRVLDVASWSANDALASFADRFTRGDSAVAIGNAWAADAATWGISSNKAYQVIPSGFGRAYHANVLTTGDGIVSCDITVPTPATVGFGLIMRRQDANNFIRIWNNGTTTQIHLQTWVGGVFGATIVAGASTWTAGVTNRWVILMQGNKYKVFIDGVDVMLGWQTDVNNRFLTETSNGLFGGPGVGSDTTRWDNFVCYPHTFTIPSDIAAGAVPVVYVPGATIAQDTFTDANGVALTAHAAAAGGAWTNILGTWTIQSNAASCATAVGSNMITQSLATPNAECSVGVITPGALPTPSVRAGIVLRYVDANNYLIVRLYKDAGTSEIELTEAVGGTITIVHKTDIGAAAVTTSTTYTLKAQVAADPNGGADLLQVFYRELRVSYKLRAANAGVRFGLYRENTDDGCVLDSWIVKQL